MKFYIPTSSLNFDNILSSESIAPEIFYQKRNYGYKSFVSVDGINYRDKIILITKIPKFPIIDNDRMNYPMVIEVNIPETLFNSYGIKMLQCVHEFELYTANQTIYINPEICKIFFFDDKSLSSIKLTLTDSLTMKMGNYYDIDFAPNENIFEWNNIYLPEEEKSQISLDISKSIEKDESINRVKGFLFAYISGLLQSIPNNVAEIRKICREMYNIISSILNDISHTPNSFIEKLNILKDNFYELDPNKKSLRDLYDSLFPDTPEVKRIIEYFGDTWIKKAICEKAKITPYNFPKFSSSLSKEEWKKINNDIFTFERKANPVNTLQQVKETIRSINIQERKLAKFDIYCIDEKQKKLFSTLLNDSFLCEGGISIDSVRIDKKKLGDDIARKVKSHFGEDEWEHFHKSYFTALRQNITNATPFDVTSSNNIIEQSIAAFLLKGENLNGLREYLENNGIGDLSFAYGFWGASIGFANIPKTLTNNLFLSDDPDSVNAVYKYIYKQVHGSDLEEPLESKQVKGYVTVPSKIKEISDSNTSDESTLEQELSKFEEYNSLEPKIKKEIISKLNEIGIFSLTEWNDENVDTIQWTPKKKQKNLIKVIKKSKKEDKTKNKKSYQFREPKINFDSQVGKDFYSDNNALNYIENRNYKNQTVKEKIKKKLLCLDEKGYEIFESVMGLSTEQMEKLESNFKYVQGKHKKKQDGNTEVIEHFINICKKEWEYQVPDFLSIKDKVFQILKNEYPD